MKLDLTKPIRVIDGCLREAAVSYAGMHHGEHVFAFVEPGGPPWARSVTSERVDVLLENIPEAPWYPDDSGHSVDIFKALGFPELRSGK